MAVEHTDLLVQLKHTLLLWLTFWRYRFQAAVDVFVDQGVIELLLLVGI